MHQLLTQHWAMLRNLKVCHEPGGLRREGETIEDEVAKRTLANAQGEAAAQLNGTSFMPADAFYSIGKKEVADHHWHVVAPLLQQLGFADLSADRPAERSARIPAALCLEFEARVVAPWQAAWRSFRQALSIAAQLQRLRAPMSSKTVQENRVATVAPVWARPLTCEAN